MKKTCFLLLCLCSVSTSFGQNAGQAKQISTQSNGVIVHESAGNEGFYTSPESKVVAVRTVQDWTLPECIDALTAIQEKLFMLEGSAEYETAKVAILEQQALIEARKQSLLSK